MAEARPLLLKCPKCGNRSVETPGDISRLDFMVKCRDCGNTFGRWEDVQKAFAAKAGASRKN